VCVPAASSGFVSYKLELIRIDQLIDQYGIHLKTGAEQQFRRLWYVCVMSEVVVDEDRSTSSSL
jgi:hypothetical protein